VGWHVEQLEVSQVILDFARAEELKAEIREDRVDCPQDLGRDLQPALLAWPAGERNVDGLSRKALGQLLVLLPGQSLFIGTSQAFLDAVGLLAKSLALRRRNLAYFLERHAHFARLAEILGVPGAQRSIVGRLPQLREGTLFQGGKIAHDEAE